LEWTATCYSRSDYAVRNNTEHHAHCAKKSDLERVHGEALRFVVQIRAQAATWPIGGYYRCRVCLRQHPVPWQLNDCHDACQRVENAGVYGQFTRERTPNNTKVISKSTVLAGSLNCALGNPRSVGSLIESCPSADTISPIVNIPHLRNPHSAATSTCLRSDNGLPIASATLRGSPD